MARRRAGAEFCSFVRGRGWREGASGRAFDNVFVSLFFLTCRVNNSIHTHIAHIAWPYATTRLLRLFLSRLELRAAPGTARLTLGLLVCVRGESWLSEHSLPSRRYGGKLRNCIDGETPHGSGWSSRSPRLSCPALPRLAFFLFFPASPLHMLRVHHPLPAQGRRDPSRIAERAGDLERRPGPVSTGQAVRLARRGCQWVARV